MTSEARDFADELLPIATCVLWMVCLSVGAAGLWLGYPEAKVAQDVSPVQTRLVEVRVDSDLLPPPPAPIEEAPKIGGAERILPAAVPLPAAPERVAVSAAPPMAVAAPSAVIAFAAPVEGLTKVVEAKEAGYQGQGLQISRAERGTATDNSAERAGVVGAGGPVPAVTHLVLGEGEGNQPAPEYPREAQLAGQEGKVGLRFTVNEAGRVTSVSTTAPSRWPLLNAAAARAVRNRWRFSSGAARTYEVTIEFQLTP